MTKPISFAPDDLPPDEMDESLLDELYEEESEPSSETVSLAEEPLFATLLRQAVYKTVPDDQVLVPLAP